MPTGASSQGSLLSPGTRIRDITDTGRTQSHCTACHCREKIHGAKALLELKLARNVEDDKKSF